MRPSREEIWVCFVGFNCLMISTLKFKLAIIINWLRLGILFQTGFYQIKATDSTWKYIKKPDKPPAQMRFAVNMKMKTTNEYRFSGVKKKKEWKRNKKPELNNNNKKRRCMYHLYDNIMFFSLVNCQFGPTYTNQGTQKASTFSREIYGNEKCWF